MSVRGCTAVAALLIFLVSGSGSVDAGARCSDGWRSYSSGRGTCSHHGGVAHWIASKPADYPGLTPMAWIAGIIAVALYSKPDANGKAWWKGSDTGSPPPRSRNGCPKCGSHMGTPTR